MKIRLPIISWLLLAKLSFLIPPSCNAQNLIPNPSFEEKVVCPDYVSELDYATGWHTLINSPDYYNVCNNTSNTDAGIVGVPVSARGYQPARTGNAFAGEVNYYTSQTDYREAFYTKLDLPLAAGVTYDMGFFTVMQEDNAEWAVDGDLGMLLTDNLVNTSQYFTYTPQVKNPHGNVLNDSMNWTQISGSYTAQGGEQYVTIGSFIRDSALTIINRGGTYNFTSYGIEDVYIVQTGHPAAFFSASNTVICSPEDCINFFDHSINNPVSWQWHFTGGTPDTSGKQNPTGICYNTPGIYPVTLIVSNASGSDTLTITTMISANNPPSLPVITLRGGDTLICSPSYFQYQWYFNGAPVFAAIDSFYVVKTNGTYAVMITDNNGCTRFSDNFLMTGTPSMPLQPAGFEIYPNPTDGNLFVGAPTSSPFSISIYNVQGMLVNQIESPAGKQIQIHGLSPGIYLFKIKSGESLFLKKIIVIR